MFLTVKPKMKGSRTPLFVFPNLRHHDFGYIALILLLIFLSNSSEAQSLDFSNQEFVLHSESTFSIKLPDYLIQVPDSSKSGIKFQNVFNDTHFLITSETKSATGHLNLEQLQEHFQDNLLFNGGLILGTNEIIIDNMRAYQSEAEWALGVETLVYLITFVDTPQRLYKIYSWTLASQKEYLTTFRKVADSFTLSKAITTSQAKL